MKLPPPVALLLVFAGLGLLALLFCFNPATGGVFPPCPFHYVTGLYCPGCGSLRALHHLLHGQLAAALKMNPLMVVSLPLLVALGVNRNWRYKPWVAWCAAGLLTAHWVLRNVPIWPFVLLAPH